MLDFLHKAVTVDTYTIVVVAMLSGWAGVLTLHVLSRTLLAFAFVPGFIMGAFVTTYLFEIYGFYPTPDRETNIVVACTLGIIVALLPAVQRDSGPDAARESQLPAGSDRKTRAALPPRSTPGLNIAP